MTFTIIQTKTTPLVDFRNGYLLIRGKSVPFEYPAIYDIINDRLRIYMKKPKKKTFIDFDLSAINAISKRTIMNTFQLFEEMNNKGTNIQVNWYYQPDDEDVYELGEICKSNFNLTIDLRESI